VTTTDFGAPPELAWLPVAKVRADERYQRTLESRRSQKLIDLLVAKFRWAAFGSLLATDDGDGGWYVIDGQHRLEAARRLGIAHVPASVLKNMTVEEAASSFVSANGSRVTVNQFALYHARLAAGDEAARELSRSLAKARIAITRYPIPENKIAAGQTMALGQLARISRERIPALAALIIGAVADAYRTVPGALRGLFFQAADIAITKTEPEKRVALAGAITAWLKERPHARVIEMAAQNAGRLASTMPIGLAHIFERLTIEHPAIADGGGAFIKPPTREQLMGRR